VKRAYTIGRGKLLFKRPTDPSFWKLGNAKDFKISFEVEKKEHYSTESGLKVKDAEIIVSLSADVEFTLDELRRETVALFLLGNETPLSQTASTNNTLDITAHKGFYYPLPHKNVTNVSLSSGTTTYQEGTDYEVDYSAGVIYVPESSTIPDGTTVTVTYDTQSAELTQIDSGSLYQISGRLLFIADPPVGAVVDVEGDVQLRPEGDLNLIGDDFLEVKFRGTFTKESAQRIFRAIYREVR